MVKEIKTSNAEKCGEQSWEKRGLGGEKQRPGRAFGTKERNLQIVLRERPGV